MARYALTLGFVIEPRWGSGGKALLKPNRLHNKRLHTDATALSTNLLVVASRLRWPSQVDWGGAGEPQTVLRRSKEAHLSAMFNWEAEGNSVIDSASPIRAKGQL